MTKKKMKKEGRDGFALWLATKAIWVLVVFFGTLTVCAGFFVAFSHGDVPMKYVWVMIGITLGISVVWRILSIFERRRVKKVLMAKVDRLRAEAKNNSEKNEVTEK